MLGRLLRIALTLALAGCHAQAALERETAPARDSLATEFDATATGTLDGVVRWQGDQPDLPRRQFFATPTVAGSDHASPHLPEVDPDTQGLRRAVVFLRDVEPRRARPWHHGQVRLEHVRRELQIHQDGVVSGTGFVRRGADIEVVSRDKDFHALRGRGACTFGIPLPDRDVISKRRLDTTGVVDLTSAAGFHWMSAHLFVADHPYFTRSDAQGRFTLEQVPPGTYELVCWLPSWVILRHERDAEAGQISRLLLAPPCEKRQTVRVDSGGTASVSFTWSRAEVEGALAR